MTLISICSGILINLLNASAALLVIRIAYKRPMREFTSVIFGSMVIRYFIVAFLVWLCLYIFNMEQFEFAFSFLISGFIILFIEIMLIHKGMKFLKASSLNSIKN